MANDADKKLGNYRLLKLLGTGGFADVYLGEHIYLKTSAAIKVLRTHLSDETLNQFVTEARTIARLKHPHIISVHDFGIENSVPFLVMDYAPYGSLRRLHPIGTRLELATFLPYVKQMAQALQYAHDRKIIHRDVKPENMLLGDEQMVMLSDFGIALTTQSMPSNPMLKKPQQDDVVGTMVYMAPEIFTSTPSFSSDQYSLAIAVYEWLSGDPPFNGSDMEIALQHVHISIPALHTKVPSLSPEVERVVMKALSKNAQDRYPTILDFAYALEQAATLLVRPPVVDSSSSLQAIPGANRQSAANQDLALPLLPFVSRPISPIVAPPIDYRTEAMVDRDDDMEVTAKTAFVDPQRYSVALNAGSFLKLPSRDSSTASVAAVLPPTSLKLPAVESTRSSKRLFDYAPSSPMTSREFPPTVIDMELSSANTRMPSPQREQQVHISPALTLPHHTPLLSKGQAVFTLRQLKYAFSLQAASTIRLLKAVWTTQSLAAVHQLRKIWSPQTVELLLRLRRALLTRSASAVKLLRQFLAGCLEMLRQSHRQIALTQNSSAMRRSLHMSSAHRLPPGRALPSINPAAAVSHQRGSGHLLSRRKMLVGFSALGGAAGVAVAATHWMGENSPTTPVMVPAAQSVLVATETPTPAAAPDVIAMVGTRPTVASWGVGQLDVFVRGTDGGLWHRHFDGSWRQWEMVMGELHFDPSVVAWGPNRFDVFVRGADDTLQHSWFDGGWHGWESLGGSLTSDPAVTSWGANRLDVFARASDNSLYHRAYDGSWHDWESLAGVLLSSPSASSWGPNRLDVFVRGADNAIWHRGYDGNWDNWESLGGSFESDPAAVSIASGHLDVFVRGVGNGLVHQAYDGNWRGWESLGGLLTSSPAAITWGNGRIDVFARTANNVLGQMWYAGGWQPWTPLT